MTTRSKEQRILVVMRKLLAQIVKDTTPGPGMRHPLNEQTIKDIRDCFRLISTRERELAEQAGTENKDRPRYID
ncbi:MAG: segregation and condensation protein A [Gammaproteobacteria bacterium]